MTYVMLRKEMRLMITLNIENVDHIKEIKETEFNFEGCCGVIKSMDGIIIGFYEISINDKEIYLDTLEILKKFQDQGYGTAFIKKLFEEYPEVTQIYGISTESAIRFYASLGAEFYDGCEKCEYGECPYNSNYKGLKEDCKGIGTCDDYSANLFTIYR